MDDVTAAADVLRSGGVVVLPTDTVYGIAVAADVPGATGRLFSVKGRTRDVPVAVLVADEAQAWTLAASPVPEVAGGLAARFWPGALTLVLHRDPSWVVDLGGDATTVGLRCPDHDLLRTLCRLVGPLATTSANRHGHPTRPTAHEVAADLEGVDLVVDGGRLSGTPSTVVDCTVEPVRVLREGAIPRAAVA